MNHPEAPSRSLSQRMAALDRGNEVRSYRANLKLDLKAGRANIINLLTNPPQKIETMKIFDLLMAVPKMGRIKVDKLLRTCRISPSKTVGGLTGRQTDELLLEMRRR